MKTVLNISRAKIDNGIGISPIKIVANRENSEIPCHYYLY